ncbi:hypothetical protein [Selenomonas ruminantium]|uniref:hypothetical protein n=1 Tax=Selenomonas ruminantium TaxID=971 RepID=UPI00047DD0C2|nr:hypothetical protein [Selenomonas ruminantium]
MEYIAHRINTVEELQKLPNEYGVELDLRDGLDGRIYIQHEPFIAGEDFEEYLKQYHHGTMILNIKSERIELKALELLKQYGVKKYFFLDSSFPMIKLLSDQGEYNIALRFSEIEGLDTIENMRGRAKWIWVDCFTKMPLTAEIADKLHSWGYKICIVSPELEGQDEKLEEYKDYLEGIDVEAVCTKIYNMGRWR